MEPNFETIGLARAVARTCDGRITLKLTVLQMYDLDRAGNGSGGNQTLCRKLHSRIDEQQQTWVLPKDLERMKKYANRPDNGTWQRLYREILDANGAHWKLV
jgi:hypothetical protein